MFWANVLKLFFYVCLKLITTLNDKNHRKICLLKFHSTVSLHCSEQSLICGVSQDVSGFYHFNMPRRCKFWHMWCVVFCLFDFPIIFCVKFWKVGAFKWLFKCWSVVSEFRYFLYKTTTYKFPVREVWFGALAGVYFKEFLGWRSKTTLKMSKDIWSF